jgi:hypothetical protein
MKLWKLAAATGLALAVFVHSPARAELDNGNPTNIQGPSGAGVLLVRSHRGGRGWRGGRRGWRGGRRGWRGGRRGRRGFRRGRGYGGIFLYGAPLLYAPYLYPPYSSSPRRYGGRCGYWARQCAANWGRNNPNFYGCMRHHRC